MAGCAYHWDAVRSAVDARQKVGQFILTGSNSIDRSKILHTGTGRIARIKMAPMSLWESGESTGEISLMELFNNPDLIIDGRMSRLDIKQLILHPVEEAGRRHCRFRPNEVNYWLPEIMYKAYVPPTYQPSMVLTVAKNSHGRFCVLIQEISRHLRKKENDSGCSSRDR